MRRGLAWQAWFELLYADLVGLRGFSALKRLVAATPTQTPATLPQPSLIEATVHAVERASRRYARQPQCLQRSIVVTRLLRRRGIDADLVIGCHLAPLRAHAWVEVAGDVISDNRDDLPYFCVLDRW